MIEQFLSIIFGSKQNKDLEELIPLVTKINSHEGEMMSLSPEQIKEKTLEFKERCKNGESLESLLPEAFALARESAHRVLGERLFDVQLMGAIVLHKGRIMEMKTGEGKTVSCVPAAYLNSLTGKGVHIVTVNDYLAKRDSEWMGPIYEYMGISVGVILTQMDNDIRKEAYAKDITYGTNNEFGFDYLRDNLAPDMTRKVQRKHNYCIVDEIDSILIDEARTPLIISGPAEDDTHYYYEVNKLVPQLIECAKDPNTGEYPEEHLVGDYKLEEKNKRITFTDQGLNHIEQLIVAKGLIKGSLFASDNFEYVHYFTQSLKAHTLFHIDVDYVVQDNKVQIVDEFTGRILYGRRYSDGLHQAIEAKEKIRIEQRNRTLATITFQNYFRLYLKISGMTGTADTEAKEFAKIYSLEVVVIPTNRPMVRLDNDDIIFLNEDEKFEAICDDIKERNKKGQPVLVGTVSIEKSEKLSSFLTRKGVRHEILNAKNHAREALIISEAGSKGAVTIATNMAGRGTDIKLGGNPEYRARKRVGTDASGDVFKKAYAEEYALWEKHYNEVREIGGLYVLGTERHESRRIDNQLRGRSGRQGDSGESTFYISLDDELMRLFGENLKSIMSRVGMKSGEPITHPWINKSIERAQKKVEDRNFEVRKHLLEYDDVLNEQRKYIYERRDEIILDDNLIERVYNTAAEIIGELIDQYANMREDKRSSLQAFLAGVKERFLYNPRASIDDLLNLPPEKVEEILLAEIREDLDIKQKEFGKENINAFIRYEYLRNIDTKWQDHLENLDALKEAVYLRAYSQKNPLLEYKLEGFHIFDQLLVDIRLAIAKKIFKVQIVHVDKVQQVMGRTVSANASHVELGQFSGSSQSSGSGGRGASQGQASGQANVIVKRSQPKVGRNDPCPCGSGKKYKFCHGK